MISRVSLTCGIILGCVLLGAAGAYAQGNSQPELQEILKRLHAIERRLDAVEGKKASAPAKDSVEPSRIGDASTLPNKKPVPGWLINVMPYSERGDTDPLFRFSLPKLPTTFSAHLSTKKIEDWVGYRGEASLNIYNPGRHVFLWQLTPSPKGSLWCQGHLKVDSKELVLLNGQSVYDDFSASKTFSQGMDLETGNHDITFQIFCSTSRGATNKIYQMSNPYDIAKWKESSFDILVRSPIDDVARSFEPKELFHYARQK